MRTWIALGMVLLGSLGALSAHGFGNPPTWNREISRLVYARCASCHREGGTAFSLMTYQDVQSRAVAIKESVAERRMPPWGAVKGFGEFRNDQGLTQEQVELFTDWVEGGIAKGNNPGMLPEQPAFEKEASQGLPSGPVIRGGTVLDRSLDVDGLLPLDVPDRLPMQIVAVLPDGRIEPLVWLYEYRNRYKHPFLFRRPLRLPAGTTIRGIDPSARIQLLQAESMLHRLTAYLGSFAFSPD